MAAASQQVAQNPVVNIDHEALLRNLEAIKVKNVGDNLWFGLDAEGDLMLHPRPVPQTNIFIRIWECLKRALECIICWVTSELPPLEQQFIWISDQVEAQLNALHAARDERGLGRFLNAYTTAVNELYRAADKMAEAEIFQETTLDHLQQKAKIRDYMITEIDHHRVARAGQREYHPYIRSVQLRKENQLPDSTVTFRTPEHRISETRQERKAEDRGLKNGENDVSIFMANDEPMRLEADVTVKRNIRPKNGKGSSDVYFGGREIRLERSKEGSSTPTLTIHNESNKNMRIVVAGLPPEKGAALLVPQGSLSVTNLDGTMFQITAIYTQELLFNFGCKLALYRAVVNEQGGFNLHIHPYHIVENLPAEDRLVDEANPLLINNVTDEPRVVHFAITRIDGTQFKHTRIVPKHQRNQHAYGTLCAQAGVDPEARPNLRVHLEQQRAQRIIH